MRARCAVLALVVCLAAPHTTPAEESTIQTAPVLNGSVAVQALGYVAYSVTVTPSVMTNPHIAGHVQAVGGSGNDIVVMVFSATDFVNWKNNHSVAPLFNSGQVTAADINVAVPDAGDYVVVLSNTFSAFTPKTVAGDIHLAWIPPALIEKQNRLEAADGFMRIFTPIFVAIMLGGLFWWWAVVWTKAHQDKKKAATEQKKAA